MRARLLAATTAVALTAMLAGCLGSTTEKTAEADPAAPPPPDLTRSDCYTVVLFDGFEISEPPEGTPPEHAVFLGEWRFGAWDGKWCHDLLVTDIKADGTVVVMDKHAPYEPWGQPATAFERTARIGPDDVLRFRHGTTQREYRYDRRTGRLKALRADVNGELVAELRRAGGSRLPPTRADALSRQRAAAASSAKTTGGEG